MKKLTKEQIKAELIEVIASDLERCAPSYSECAYLAETIIQRFIALESLGEEEECKHPEAIQIIRGHQCSSCGKLLIPAEPKKPE